LLPRGGGGKPGGGKRVLGFVGCPKIWDKHADVGGGEPGGRRGNHDKT